MIRRIIFVIICVFVIAMSYIYCAPISMELYRMGLNPLISGLVMNISFCLIIKYQAKKGNLISLIDRTNNLLPYVPYFFAFCYGLIAFMSLTMIIWSKIFFLSLTIIPAFISIDCIFYVKNTLKI